MTAPTNNFRTGLFEAVNQMKSAALTYDQHVKAADHETKVKYHHVDAAVTRATQQYLTSGGNLETLFGPMDDETRNDLTAYLAQKSTNIESANDDRTLNAALFGSPGCEINDKFFSKQVLDEEPTSFHGRIKVQPSFGGEVKENELVNITLSLDEESTRAVTEAASTAIQNSPILSGAVIGRLTGTNDLTERHVSLGLRVPYTKKLMDYITELNAGPSLGGRTAGEIHAVFPPDIRAKISAVSVLDAETVKRLEAIQRAIADAAEKEGNTLPRLHITQANKGTEISDETLQKWFDNTDVKSYLNSYLSE